MEGQSFGRYEPLFRLGVGGMAEVFVARMRGEGGFERLVALKRMLPHLAEDPRFVDMFLDEARIAANVQSPHVVATLDLGRADSGQLYLVMELVLGASLGTLLRAQADSKTPLPIDVAADIVTQAARGLHDAHEATTPLGKRLDIVHRDVAPKNILVGHEGRVRVSDFGVARALARLSVTAPGQLKGTFSYASPEQASGQPLDRRSDLFSLGVVAWECFTGRRLFAGADPLSLVAQVRRSPIATVRSVRPEVPAAVDAVVMRALRREPGERFATALEMAVELSRAAGITDADLVRRRTADQVSVLAGARISSVRARIEGPITEPDLSLLRTHTKGRDLVVEPTGTEESSQKTPSIRTETLPPEAAKPQRPVDAHAAASIELASVHDAPTVALERRSNRALFVVGALAAAIAIGIGAIAVGGEEPEAAAPPAIVRAAPHDAPPAIEPPIAADPRPEPIAIEPVIVSAPSVVEAAPTETPRPRVRRISPPTTRPSEPPSRLMGLDDFDRETGRSH